MVGIYAGYVFLSGWAFLDSYFRFFGIDPKSLDISFYETLTKGFTPLFSDWSVRTVALWTVYIVILVVPIVLEKPLKTSVGIRVVLVLFFAGLFPTIYFLARGAGEERARLDTGDNSRLADIIFTLPNEAPLHGRLVLLRAGTYFIHGVVPLTQPSNGKQLSIFSAEKFKEVKVTEHQ
jgi:hypothetical protein